MTRSNIIAQLKYLFVCLLMMFLVNLNTGKAQDNFSKNPDQAQIITSDIPAFWEAFDKNNKDAYESYLENGSKGLKDFIPMRIESAKNLFKTVKKKRVKYEAIRANSLNVSVHTAGILDSYSNFKQMYPKAVFPPVYFVIGALNTGGTASNNGLIIGVERIVFEDIPTYVTHELIHFNQNYPRGNNTLLKQSIREGSADFLAELISKTITNKEAFAYGKNNEKMLKAEFKAIMTDTKYRGWLYGSKGKPKDRPNDLGYWIGYEICKAYYDKQKDKSQAIYDILNITDFNEFKDKSGYFSD